MTEYTLAETETSINQSADDRATWRVYTADPVMIRKMDAIGATLIREYDDGVGRMYELKAEQLSFKKGKRQLSPESQAALRERLARMRARPALQGANG